MRLKGTWVLVGAVILSVGYALYDVQSESKATKLKEAQSYLLKADPEQISELELKNAKGGDILIERTTEGWKLKSPLQEVADQSSVQDYLDAAFKETSHEKVKDGDDIDWKLFGLDAPVGTLSFKLNNGAFMKIDVSAKKNFAGDSYIRLQQINKVFLASSTWLTRTEKTVFDFRDKRILRKSAAAVHSYKFLRGKSAIVLNKVDQVWSLPSQPKWKIDQTRASEMVYMVNTVNAVEFTKEGPPGSLKEYGLDKPDFSIELELEDKLIWKAAFARNQKKESYVQTFDPPRILKISTQDMDKFAKTTEETFRDRHEPFDFDKTNIKKIHVTNAESSVDFTMKSDDEWVIDKMDKAFDYQVDRPKAIMALVRNLEIADFDPPKMEAPASPLASVNFLDEHGKGIYEISFIGTYKKNIDNMNKSLVLIKTPQFAQAVGVDEGTYRSIGLDSVVKKKSEKPVEKAGKQ